MAERLLLLLSLRPSCSARKENIGQTSRKRNKKSKNQNSIICPLIPRCQRVIAFPALPTPVALPPASRRRWRRIAQSSFTTQANLRRPSPQSKLFIGSFDDETIWFLVQRLNLVCSNVERRHFLGSVMMMGLTLGSFLGGPIGEKKKACEWYLVVSLGRFHCPVNNIFDALSFFPNLFQRRKINYLGFKIFPRAKYTGTSEIQLITWTRWLNYFFRIFQYRKHPTSRL